MLSDKDIFEKHTKVLFYSGYFELLDFNEFERAIKQRDKERDEHRVCKTCEESNWDNPMPYCKIHNIAIEEFIGCNQWKEKEK